MVGYLIYVPLGWGVAIYNGYQWYDGLYRVLNAEPGTPDNELLNLQNWFIYPWRKDLVWNILFALGGLTTAVPVVGPIINLLWCWLMYLNMIWW